MTSPEPTAPTRPDDAADGALFDAIATEHATIYGYGIVSARALPEDNWLVGEAMADHRVRRESAIALIEERDTDAPLPATGYSMPREIDTPADAETLAVTMERDAATAWRAVVEQASDPGVRAFGVSALTECAVMAARWRRLRDDTVVTVPFPGGTE